LLICQHQGRHVGSASFAALIASFATQIGKSCSQIRVNWFSQIELQNGPSFLKTFLLRRIPISRAFAVAFGVAFGIRRKEVGEKSEVPDVGLYAFSRRARGVQFSGG